MALARSDGSSKGARRLGVIVALGAMLCHVTARILGQA